ncbi:hypothetical protein RSOLAG22IIIB_12326 [Rhizoctonia solani]|uniref:Uncharacterized protein n=1 Tax=Rhizoctonia solani TaxID=456999 RepID=A0A0K6GDD6_9AGAM|nr:unnamed protein product [Rhizoctonia solani]CUA76476.1 hypothetical protein RSOLAG22IIIB_12326 [Rhizoctonia solani]
MALTFYVALFFQIVGWVYAEVSSTTTTPVVPTAAILDGPNTSLKPMIPIIIGSALGGFFGFSLIIFGGIYLLRRRRSKDVDDMVEGAHFPTMSPPISARSQMYPTYTGYSYWEKADENIPPVPPGLPTRPIRS